MPDLIGLSGMDAVTLLENNGYKTRTTGSGKVVKQSVKPGDTLTIRKTILLELL
jgi:cell division protein FtsI (penicillin-binding protein 3)